MFQYKAVLVSSKKVIATGHSVKDIENDILSFRRKQKKGEHTQQNEKIEIIHMQRNQKEGSSKAIEKIVKIV
ncbi:MAG: MAG6790 family protein [Metamycoplasmataceae bacterium]